MFINSREIVPFLIMANILILVIACIAVGLAIWTFRKLYKRMTGRDADLIVLLAGVAFLLLAATAVVLVL